MQAEIYGLTGGARRARVEQLLERFGLAEAAGRIARTYSGGMQRRLDLALGLVHRPKVLFLDEPTTGLDPEARAELWREIERLAGEEEMTILLTTHYLEEADRLAAQLAIVDRGRVVAEGTPDELNPLTIALWTVSFPAAAPAQAIGSTAGAAAVLLGVGLGTLTWYGGFSTAVALTRKRVGDRLLRLVDFGVGSGLIAFGGLLGYRSLHEHA
jgi:ABC-type sugar transport system ATPase subunit